MSVAQRLNEVRSRIATAATAAGRDPGEVALLAVSKTFPAPVVAEAVAAGQRALGENRVQEALEKQPLLAREAGDLAWHLIGPLQRNKVRKVVGHFTCLQGIDSLKLARAVDRVAGELAVRQTILLQVKIGGEESKSGFEPARLREEIDELAALSHLQIDGLMTIPPPVEAAEEARPYFARLRELRDALAVSSGLPLRELSMGMSNDYPAAIAEGATLVRVGSAIFGSRE
ncbi:YggS family pyridoxal phosphate-dependent enzyme [Roseibacillus ishigakijimensis]|uniref:Pyridoxal phosphate homeostasis protein n=1 Tax=Roseibacillus ishigakijimensis TaxID=454146 RepID=A0A934RS84_9BACT|nr:YggS family pyridoxal phosphate-dependent enzyme [Roseibacillus ishigakijimensis]MBK1834701.1 YggS family pyridoxal phosphate-dependent enzyme [Roseibacillus ishigakijimensis]